MFDSPYSYENILKLIQYSVESINVLLITIITVEMLRGFCELIVAICFIIENVAHENELYSEGICSIYCNG